MPADEVTHGMDVDASRARTGPRHAAPKRPLFTRFHMPAGKAIALAAMPTAVLMGMGFTPTLAIADSNDAVKPTSNSLTADEYKDCVSALEQDGKDSASPTPSPSASESASGDTTEPSPSATSGDSKGGDSGSGSGSGSSSSPDSGSDDKAEPTPSPSASASKEETSGDAGTASPSPSESGGGLLSGIGDAVDGLLGGGTTSDSPSPTPSASESASGDTSSGDGATSDAGDAGDAGDAVEDTTDKVTDTVKDTVEGTTDKASEAAEDTTDAVGDATDAAKDAVPTPSPSASETTDPENCPAATDAEGGVDNKVPLPDDPWYLDASSLLLKGADYKGVVEVKTAGGTTKKVLKYVISDGTDIGDLHQTVQDKQAGKTYHVQAAKGSTSTIRDGQTVMYTESISGNLLGLIPVTFTPENPPPLNIPLIYFTNVKVVQAGQFGGTLHVPGLHQFVTD